MIRVQKIHFVGIGGVGMSGIAEILLDTGYDVTGSDIADNPTIHRLKDLGAVIHLGHRAENVEEADAVVISSAISPGNVEVLAARERGIPVVRRAEMLAELMRLKYGIAIAGTHGKTTTTSLVAMVLTEGGIDPTVVIGGRLEQLGSGAKVGAGEYLVAEADESDGSFLKLSPAVAVVTNIDDDHLDFYGDMGRLAATFGEFCNRVPFYGFALLCSDDPRLRGIASLCSRRVVTFGLGEQADYRADRIETTEEGSRFRILQRGDEMAEVSLRLVGIHNVTNALAAAAVGIELGLEPAAVVAGLERFRGVDRRMQLKGKGPGESPWRVYDDYAHHPTEITATLAAARALARGGRLLVVFQPHRYSRTALLYEKLAAALTAADRLWLLPVYPAGEEPREGVSSGLIAEALRLKGYSSFTEIEGDARAAAGEIARILEPRDLLLTLGAGDVWKIGEEILRLSAVRPERKSA
ncbi:MAG: UDP-N-acetylmuramate--L-alanine ligase [Candidatus Hydrogenedentota bacterium]|nr:MAG: UDP-N-acetylmuramate--L-alanine ligase [Candidatus Hydrogenedentota bacterium]